MDEVDTMLARLARVPSPRSLGDDPAFVARLDRTAARGEVTGMLCSVALGIAVAGLMVVVHPGRSVARGGFLLVTSGGEVL